MQRLDETRRDWQARVYPLPIFEAITIWHADFWGWGRDSATGETVRVIKTSNSGYFLHRGYEENEKRKSSEGK